MNPDKDDWAAYKLMVLDRLDRMEAALASHDERECRFQDEHSKELVRIREEIAKLKVRSGLWGAAAGAIPSLITIIILYLETR